MSKKTETTEKNKIENIPIVISEFAGEELPFVSHEDIQTRAYFIAEERERTGTEGGDATDWYLAEVEMRDKYCENV